MNTPGVIAYKRAWLDYNLYLKRSIFSGMYAALTAEEQEYLYDYGRNSKDATTIKLIADLQKHDIKIKLQLWKEALDE